MDELSHLFKKREQAKNYRSDRLHKDGLVLREMTRLRQADARENRAILMNDRLQRKA